MIMAINLIPGVKAKTEAVVRDVTARGLNVFNARVGDIKLVSARASL